MNRLRWLILVLGPLPIVGSSWAVSAWFKSEPAVVVARNDVLRAEHDVNASANAGAEAELPSTTNDQGSLAQACQQSADRLADELGPECRAIACAPFVLAGNLSLEQLQAWHARTIAPAVQALQACYFTTPPRIPITVLLLADEQSYNRYCQRLFGDSGISIYGYYKPHYRTVIVNAATGEGTLLHELTHALMDVDFPQAPTWFNEGLASLHEQCTFRAGDDGPWIEGLVNWRLAGLQEVVRQGRLRSLAALVEEPEFRGPLEGLNYAQARYFCLYLQQHGLLETFYRRFRHQHTDDPRGANAVLQVISQATWEQLDSEFQRWVLGLTPPAQEELVSAAAAPN